MKALLTEGQRTVLQRLKEDPEDRIVHYLKLPGRSGATQLEQAWWLRSDVTPRDSKGKLAGRIHLTIVKSLLSAGLIGSVDREEQTHRLTYGITLSGETALLSPAHDDWDRYKSMENKILRAMVVSLLQEGDGPCRVGGDIPYALFASAPDNAALIDQAVRIEDCPFAVMPEIGDWTHYLDVLALLNGVPPVSLVAVRMRALGFAFYDMRRIIRVSETTVIKYYRDAIKHAFRRHHEIHPETKQSY